MTHQTAAEIMARAERVDAIADQITALLAELGDLEPQFRAELKAAGEPMGAGAGWGGFRRLARGVLSIAVTGGNRNVGRMRIAETLNRAWGISSRREIENEH